MAVKKLGKLVDLMMLFHCCKFYKHRLLDVDIQVRYCLWEEKDMGDNFFTT